MNCWDGCALPKLIQPSDKTLSKYGMDDLDWVRLALGQGSVCAICKKLPPSGRLMIDHEHRKGFKRMSPDQRKDCVRGLLCFRDNYHFTARGMDIERAKNLLAYLERYATTRSGG